MKCNQCDSLYINGVFCHETGCPNTRKVYDPEDQEWKTPEPEQEEEIEILPEKYRTEVAGVGENVWSSNGKEYDTVEEGKKWLDGLADRWFGYDMSRVVPVDTPKRELIDITKQTIYQNFRKQ